MPIIFPSFDITGIRPSRWYAAPLDYPKITQSFEFEDGGKNFNEVADNAPRHWEYGHTGLSFADAQQFDDFYNLVRLAQSFDFKDKYGATWHNVYVESYTRNHDAHKSWSITVTFHLVNYDGSFTPAPVPPSLPTGLRATVLSDSSIRWDCDPIADTIPPSVPARTAPTGVTDSGIVWHWLASTDNVAVTGYELQIATDAGYTTGVRNIPLGNVLSYADTGLTDSTHYYSRVRAHDAAGNYSAYSSSTDATTDAHTWSPADLGTDVFYWFEGDPLGLTDGTTITTLVDQGPNNNDGTASGLQRPILKTAICNGHDVIRFDHSFIQHFVLPDPSALTEANVFVVLKATNAGGSYGLWKLGGTADETLYGFSGPNIYSMFGSTVRRGPFTVASVSDTFHIYSVRSKTNFWQGFFDGVSLAAADTTNTFIMDATAYLGSSAAASSDSLDGDIAAFIMTSRDLTTTEWDNMISYLQTKFATP